MASPLGWFRRHQTGMMVVFGMVLMGIFGLGSVAMMIQPGQLSNSYGKETAVTWSEGNISKGKLENTRFLHFQTLRFLRGLQQAAIEKQGDKYFSALPRDMMIRAVAPENSNVSPEKIDSAIMQRMVFAKAAEDQGVVVNDAMVNDYFARLAVDANFTERDLEAINGAANNGQVELVEVRNHMKMELAAQQYQIMMFAGLPSMANPTEAAESYTRLNQQIECSTYPIKVADFVSKVNEEPAISDLKKLYKEGKYKLADPTMQRPGFKVGKQVKVQYVYADPTVFLENEMRTVTDAQVQEKYDELVAAEDNLVIEYLPPEETTVPDDTGAESESNDPAPAPELESSDPGLGETPSSDPAPAPETDPAPAPETVPEAGDTPEAAPADPESTEGTSVYPKSDRVVFTSLQQEEGKTTEQASEQLVDQLLESDPEPAPTDTEQAEATPSGLAEGPSMLEDEGGEEKQQTPILSRVRTLDEELAKKIRTDMVAGDALLKMKDAIAVAQAEVQDRQFDFIEWEALTDKEKKSAVKPAGVDIKELAKTLDLQSGETELVTLGELRKDEFGSKSAKTNVPDRYGRTTKSSQTVARVIEDRLDKLTLMESDIFVELFTNKNYVWWLTEKEDTLVRTFAEAEEDVREYWRFQRARELAIAEAKKIAEKINSGNMLLSESEYANDKQVTTTGNFTWLSNSGFAGPVNVDRPDDGFMEVAFGLELSEAGAAFNETEEVVYVIQKIADAPRSQEELTQDFLDDWSQFKRIASPVSGLIGRRNREMQFKELEQLSETYDINWVSQ